MATLVVNRSDLFPVGTTVKAYALTTAEQGHSALVREGEPKGANAGSATVNATGVLELTRLAENVPYVVAAEVAGAWRYLQVRVSVTESLAQIEEGELPPSVVTSTAAVDLCRAYGAEPGKDITAALQRAINTAHALSRDTDIYCSLPGLYPVNGAVQTGTVDGYTYEGQILFPARKFGEPRITIRIRGLVPAPRVWQSTPTEPAGESGCILLTNTTSGNMFDAIPAEEGEGPSGPWTNINGCLQNITLRAPENPQCGLFNAASLIESSTDGVALNVSCNGSKIPLPTHGTVALTTPRKGHGLGLRLKDTWINGFGYGLDHAEYAILDNVTIQESAVGIRPHATGHSSTYLAVFMANCPTLLEVPAGTTAVINGKIDFETGGGEFTVKTVIKDEGNNLSGSLLFYPETGPEKGWHSIGGNGKDLSLANLGRGGIPSGATLPADTVTRVTAAELPGTSDISSHQWTVGEGKAEAGAGEVKSKEAAATTSIVAPYQFRASSGSRTVSSTIVTGAAGYNIQQIINKLFKTASTYLYVKLSGGKVVIEKEVGGVATVLAESGAGVIAEHSEYEVLTILSNPAVGKTIVTVNINGTEAVKYEFATRTAWNEVFAENAGETRKQDGLRWSSDTTSACKAFSVLPSIA
jgi:hypothetical protein